MIDAGFARLEERAMEWVTVDELLVELGLDRLDEWEAFGAELLATPDIEVCREWGIDGERFGIRMRRRVPCITSLGSES